MFGIGYIVPRFSEDQIPIGFKSELLVQAVALWDLNHGISTPYTKALTHRIHVYIVYIPTFGIHLW